MTAFAVADPIATEETLALIRERLEDDSDAYADVDLLHRIYVAVTGDSPEHSRG